VEIPDAQFARPALVVSVLIVMGDSKTLVGTLALGRVMSQRRRCVLHHRRGFDGELDGDAGGEGRRRTTRTLARAAEQRNLENGGVPVPPLCRRRRGAGTLHIFEVRRYK